jgi:hypothetical protein
VTGTRWMDVEEAMSTLRVSRQRIHALIKRGKIVGRTEGVRTWVTRRSVMSYKERRRRWFDGQRKRVAGAE